MFYVVLAVFFLLLAATAPTVVRRLLPQATISRPASIAAATLFLLLALVAVIEPSIVSVPADKVGLVEAKYGFKA